MMPKLPNFNDHADEVHGAVDWEKRRAESKARYAKQQEYEGKRFARKMTPEDPLKVQARKATDFAKKTSEGFGLLMNMGKRK